MKYFWSFVGLMQLAEPTSHYEFQPQLSSKSSLHSKNLNKHEAKPAVDPFAYIPNHDKKSSSEGGRRNKSRKEEVCWRCGRAGHVAQNCIADMPKRHASCSRALMSQRNLSLLPVKRAMNSWVI